MVKLLTALTAGLLALALSPVTRADQPPRHHLELGVDLSYLSVSGYPSWTGGGAGKLRYDEDGLVLSRAFMDFRYRLTDTLEAKVDAQLYTDNIGHPIDLTEAYLDWRPLGASANRYRFKLGAFYPRVSLENTGPGWSSPYTISPSALNTWVGEELRTVGLEGSWTRRPQSLGGMHTFTLYAAIFYYNDPAGALLSWKGWSIHDRQTRYGDELPLPPLPQIQPGMYFQRQDPYVAIFREIDNEPGYYLGGEWRYGKKVLARLMHYDNRGDPRAFENGQYAWGTDFDLVGVQLILPGDIGLIYQWMSGLTVMGPVYNGTHVVDANYYSDFLLLTRAFGPHRVSARYDRFEVDENDQVPLDNNSEYGHAWTMAYTYQVSTEISLAAEWLAIETYREAWEYYGLDEEKTEYQLQLALRIRFGSGH
ncbi:MAG: hypothetical protein MUP90_01555 [Gammaproteobacteria bacterium]|nr:hypothetical protein [Gammaproteobacteria bacterium]